MLTSLYKTPWPWFGGKADAAPAVWRALGDVDHYVEPFAGSLAVLLRRPHPCNRPYYSETVNDADGLLCLGPEARVLMGDLTWRAIGDVVAGDDLIAFDEHNLGHQKTLAAPQQYRRWRRTTAIRTNRVVRDCYRLTFDDGTTVVASGDHQWLCGSHRPGSNGGRGWRWVKTSALVCNRQWQRSWVMKVCAVVDREETHGAGWVGGFLDGEGNVRDRGWQITASQKPDHVAERFFRSMTERGFDVSRAVDQRSLSNPRWGDIANFVVNGGMRESLRLLMTFRPERLIVNALRFLEDRTIYGRDHQAVGLVSKEPMGLVEVVALETGTHTYIAEGLASHNCNAWRSMQLAPDAMAEAASWPVSEADLHARHLALVRWRDERQLEHLMGDPAYHDPVMGGWWAWGQSCWIGGGWCSGTGGWTVGDDGRIFEQARGTREPGVSRQLPHLTGNGRGVNHAGTREPGVGEEPDYHPMTMPELTRWFRFLSARLRHVRILNGDWCRAMTSGVLRTIPVRQGGACGVFFDPPYSGEVRDGDVYSVDSGTVAADVRAWCIEHGAEPDLRIALAGFAGEGHEVLEAHGWRVEEWFRKGFLKGGMAQQSEAGHSQGRERLWMSPACLGAAVDRQGSLF